MAKIGLCKALYTGRGNSPNAFFSAANDGRVSFVAIGAGVGPWSATLVFAEYVNGFPVRTQTLTISEQFPIASIMVDTSGGNFGAYLSDNSSNLGVFEVGGFVDAGNGAGMITMSDLGLFATDADKAFIPTAYMEVGSRATLPSGPVTWRGAGAGGWVIDSLTVRPIRSTPFEVMANPPTVAISTTHDAALTQMFRATGPGSAGGAFTQIGAIPFRFVKSHKITYSASTQQWDDAFVTSKAVQTGNSTRGAGILGVKFIFIGTVLEIMVSGSNQKHRIKVTEADGYSRYVSLTPTQSTNDGAYNYIKVTFSGYGQRTIEFQQQNATSAGFGGVYTEPTGTILPAPIVGPRILLAGDSFTEGTGTTDAGLSGYVQAISECLGVDDVCASGVGGTGYVATSGGSKPKLRDRLTADVLEIPHDICVFAMGINDYNISVPNSLAECELCITQYLASAPGRLVLASPYFTSSTMLLPSAFLQLYRGIKALAAKYSLDFIDLVQMPISSEIAPLTAQLTAPISAGGTSIVTTNVLPAGTSWEFADGTIINVTTSGTGSYGSKTTTLPFPISAAQASGATLTMVGNGFWTGNGKSGAPTGKGNSDIFVGGTDGNDATHPTGNGHSALGYYLAARLAEILAKYKLW